MASAPNGDGTLDIRSAAILQDAEFNKNLCAPGATAANIRGPFYRGASKLIQVVTKGNRRRSPYYTPEDDELNAPSRLDTGQSWVSCLCSATVIFVVCGLVYSYGVWIGEFWRLYGPFVGPNVLNQIDAVILIGAASMSIMILTGPVATCIIKPMGHRLTAITGLLLMFFGFMMEGLAMHFITYIANRALLLPFGAGLVYTSAHHISNIFDRHLMFALLILSISGIFGILFFFWFTKYLFSKSALDYKWVMLTLGVFILITIAVTYAFPRKFIKSRRTSDMNRRIRNCIREKAKAQALKRAAAIGPNSNDELKSCLCVCVCNMSSCDCGFFLWVVITMTATLTFHIPYLFIYVFLNSPLILASGYYADITPDSLMGLLGFFCTGNLLGRIYVLLDIDFTFSHNRIIFQCSLLGSGILYFIFKRATTWGWMAVWLVVVGMVQGLMSSTMPRVTLQTVPIAWIKMAWTIIVLADGLATFLGPMLLVVLGSVIIGKDLPFYVIGLTQIIGAVLAFLIPNEEHNFEPDPDQIPPNGFVSNPKQPGLRPSGPRQLPPLRMLPPPRPRVPVVPRRPRPNSLSARAARMSPNSYIQPRLFPTTSPCCGGAGGMMHQSPYSFPMALPGSCAFTPPCVAIGTYACECPICKKIGTMSTNSSPSPFAMVTTSGCSGSGSGSSCPCPRKSPSGCPCALRP